MRRAAVRVASGIALAAALVAALTIAVLPPIAGVAGTPATSGLAVRVAYHVHSTRSDGTGTIAAIAAAARRHAIDVVVVTDHGDATREPDPPAYVDGVLVIDGVEVSTWGGHYVALGAGASPFPLGGEPDSVVEDVRRLGGFGIAAHPGSAKDGLRWRDWDTPIDGLEWLNADSEWRDQPHDLWRGLLAYPWRPAEAVTALLDRPAFELTQWDRLTALRPVVGLAAHDAHARVGVRGMGEPYDGWVALEAPSYAATFGAFANVVMLGAPLRGRGATDVAAPTVAAQDASAVLAAIRAGRVYSVLTGIAAPGQFSFTAESGGRTASAGEHLQPAGPVRFRVTADAPAGASTLLMCGGAQVARSSGGTLAWDTGGEPGACRPEIRVTAGGREVPWLVANPIYVRGVLTAQPPASATTATVMIPLAGSASAASWASEVRDGSFAGVDSTLAGADPAVRFRWRLGPEAPPPFAAIRIETPRDLPQFDRLIVRGRADRPTRVWFQLRVPAGEGQRWGTSVFFDAVPREVSLPFSAMLPLGDADQSHPPLDAVSALLVVVDTVHAAARSEGTLTLGEVRLAR